jgi:Fuc2NAc and GlcNAc transferase
MRAGTLSVSVGVVTLVATALLTGVVRRRAILRGMLDVPNPRSSHIAATPRGGGLAIALVASVALGALAFAGTMRTNLLWVLIGGGGAVALVGFVDDRRPVSAGIRLLVHVAAALWAVFWLGGLSAIPLHHQVLHLGWIGDVLAILAVVWVLNLFNFMDGIDGIAASEAVFVTGAALAPLALCGVSADVSVATLTVGAACCGFLPWNWPPAKIFMGDVGSGYVGYAVAALALAAARQSPVMAWVWLILGGVFFVDATVTLVRRLLGGERVYEAHRAHAYQWLARRWGSHRRVTIAVLLVNVLWLLPCALLATLQPSYAALTVVVALAPLALVAIAAGAGRGEGHGRAPR